MKSYRKELWFHARHRREFINITPQVEAMPERERHPGRNAAVQRHAHHRECLHQRR